MFYDVTVEINLPSRHNLDFGKRLLLKPRKEANGAQAAGHPVSDLLYSPRRSEAWTGVFEMC